MTWEEKARDSILDKMDKVELVGGGKQPAGIGWQAAADAMREVLGNRLALPPSPDTVWMIRMSTRIRSLGLSVQDCKSIAKVQAAKGWKTYSFESCIKFADTLLAEAQLDIPAVGKSGQPSRAPLDM